MANITEGKRYMHIRKQTVYTVLYLGSMEKDGSPCVVYTEAGADNTDSTVWVRPLSEFKERFERIKP